MAEGDPLVLRSPALVNDTLSGIIEMTGDSRHGTRTRIPLENVVQLEVREGSDPAATAGGVFVGIVTVGFLVYLAVLGMADLG